MVLLLLLCEVICRLTNKYPITTLAYSKELIWKLNPGETKTEGELKVTFNKYGFRDRDHAPQKAAGTKRIMVVGDSYTFGGTDYSDEDLFTFQLEDKLNGGENKSIRYEVMNASVPAWATDQQLTYLQNEGMRYKPDYLILMTSPNDFREIYGKRMYELTADTQLVKNPVWLPRKLRIGWFLANHSSFFQYLQTKVFPRNYGTFGNIYLYYPVNFGVEDEKDWDRPLFLKKEVPEVEKAKLLYRMLFSEIAVLCNKNGCKLMVAIIPTKVEFSTYQNDAEYQPGKIAGHLEQVTSEVGVPFLNLYEKADSLEEPLSIFIDWEYHFDQQGQDFTAEHLYRFFKENE